MISCGSLTMPTSRDTDLTGRWCLCIVTLLAGNGRFRPDSRHRCPEIERQPDLVLHEGAV